MARRELLLLLGLGTACAACSSSSGDGTDDGTSGMAGNGDDGLGLGPGDLGGGSNGSSGDGGLLDDLRNAACASEVAATEPLPSVLQLVVDTSGSMDTAAPGGGGSRWDVTRAALSDALEALPASTGVGILYYPNMRTTASSPTGTASDPPRDPSACVSPNNQVPLDLLGPAGSPHRQAAIGSLDTINGPRGGTPTHDAYRLGLAALNATTLPGNRFLLLITDGQPTFLSGCRGTGRIVDAVDPRPIIEEVEGAASTGVRTFSIGVPGSEEVGVPVFSDARTWLSMTSSVGGTALPGCSDDGPNFCHFDMTEEADFSVALRAALGRIIGQVLTCSYYLPEPPGGQLDPDRVNVIFTSEGAEPEIIPRAATDACEDGWRYSSDGTRIDLCESTCDRVQATDMPNLELLFGCVTETARIR